MPETEVLFYCETDGLSPVKEWLDDLYGADRKAYNKCLQVISRLATFGHELRRPVAVIKQAMERKARFEAAPEKHTFQSVDRE